MAISAASPRGLSRHTAATLAIAAMAIMLLWPIGMTLWGVTWESLVGVFADPVLRGGLVNSTIIAVATTGLCFVIALPLAVIASTYEFRGKAVLSAVLLLPLVLPPFVGVIGLRQLLGPYGAVNALLASAGWIDPAHPIDFLASGMAGVIVLEALHLYPIIYLNAAAALGNLDPALGQAAENLGASRWMRFRRVTLPLILPGLFAGGTIVFIWSFTELGTPLMFDYYAVTPVQIFYAVQEATGENPRPYALVTVVLVLSVVFYAISRWAVGGSNLTTGRTASVAAASRVGGWRAALVAAPFILVALAAAMPHIGVVLTSLSEPGAWYRTALPPNWTGEHYTGALTHPLAAGSIRNSLVYAMGATVLDLVLGLTVAWLVVRSRPRGAWLLDALSMLPLAVPGLVLAFGYVAVSIQIAGWCRAAGVEPPSLLQLVGENPDPLLFLVVAYAVRRLPYMVRAAAAGLEQTSEELELAARNLGASWGYTLRRIVLPLIAANLVAGTLLAFSFAMLEVSDSLILAQREEHYPLTKAIFSLYERLGDGPNVASAMGVWAMVLLTVTLVGASIMLGKRIGAVFRA